MKISDLKLVHLILFLSILLWCYLFFDSQQNKYQLGFQGWQREVVAAINTLSNRVTELEKRK